MLLEELEELVEAEARLVGGLPRLVDAEGRREETERLPTSGDE